MARQMRRDDAQQFTTQSGGNSRLLFGQQTNYYTRVPIVDTSDARAQGKTLGNFYKYIPIVTAITLADQTETISIEFLKGSSSANKYQQGPFRYGGGFSIGASTEGTQLFFQGITNDKEPVAKPATFPGLEIAGTWTTRYGTFSGSPNMNLNNMEVTGGADPTTATDTWTSFPMTSEFGDTTEDKPQRLEVVIGKNGGESASEEQGTVEIEGYDYHGQRIRERIRIQKPNTSDASFSRTRSYFGKPPDGRNTRFRVQEPLVMSTTPPFTEPINQASLGIRSRDERVEVTFDLQDADFLGGWTIEAQKGSGVVHTYVGVYPVSMSVSLARTSALTYDFECLAWDMHPYENAAAVDTTEGKLTIPGVHLEDGVMALRFDLDRNPDTIASGTYTVTIPPLGGYTAAVSSAVKIRGSGDVATGTSTWSVPVTYSGSGTATEAGIEALVPAVTGGGTVDSTTKDGILSTIDYETFSSTITSSSSTANRTPSGKLPFGQSPQELYTGWQCQLKLARPGRPDDPATVIPLLDTTFTVNQTIEQAELIIGERNPGPLFRSGLREVTLSGTMLLTRDRNWIQEFRDNAVFDKGELILANIVTGGFPYTTVFKFGHGQLTTAPDATVDGLGLVSVPFNMMFFDEDFGDPTDFSIVVTYHQEDWFGIVHGNRPTGQTYPPSIDQYNGGLRHYNSTFIYETTTN